MCPRKVSETFNAKQVVGSRVRVLIRCTDVVPRNLVNTNEILVRASLAAIREVDMKRGKCHEIEYLQCPL
jgi:hypothetical protein